MFTKLLPRLRLPLKHETVHISGPTYLGYWLIPEATAVSSVPLALVGLNNASVSPTVKGSRESLCA